MKEFLPDKLKAELVRRVQGTDNITDCDYDDDDDDDGDAGDDSDDRDCHYDSAVDEVYVWKSPLFLKVSKGAQPL